MPSYKFGAKSQKNLGGVHPVLRKIARMALEKSTVDFGISEGLRGLKKQRKLYNAGLTKTMQSNHLTGRAVDIVCIEDGRAVWDAAPYIKAADAFQEAGIHYARELQQANLDLAWGGCWQSICGEKKPHILCEEYKQRCDEEGRTPFLDFVHFELRNCE